MSKVVTLFYNKLNCLDPKNAEIYAHYAEEMVKKAKNFKGFISVKSFTAHDGERLTISEFETLEDMQAWKNDPDHKMAQKLGVEKFYEYYKVVTSKVIYENDFNKIASKK